MNLSGGLNRGGGVNRGGVYLCIILAAGGVLDLDLEINTIAVMNKAKHTKTAITSPVLFLEEEVMSFYYPFRNFLKIIFYFHLVIFVISKNALIWTF